MTPPHVKRLHWGFEDPAKATGTEEEIQAKFREVRDAIRDRIQGCSTNCQSKIELKDRVSTQHWTAGRRSG